MKCNHEVQQGFTAMKMDVSAEQAAAYLNPELHLFNVVLVRKYTGPSGVDAHTQVSNLNPLTFDKARQRVCGFLTSLGMGILGFQSVVDCWIEPIDLNDFQFESAAARDKWLAAYVEQQRARRELEAQEGINPALLRELAELRGKVARIHQGVL